MIKALDVVGLDVITINEGKKVASVKDVIYDQGSQKVLAFLLDEGGIFIDPHIVLLSDIKNIGTDALMVETVEDIKSAADVNETIRSIAKDRIFLTETKMVTTEGENLGRVSDIYFDPLTGRVLEFELSQGIKNLATGKKRIKVEDIVSIGQDATVVRAQVLEKVVNQKSSESLEEQTNQLKSQTLYLWGQIKGLFKTSPQKNQINTSQNSFQYFAHQIKRPTNKLPVKKDIEQFNQQINLTREEIHSRYLQAQKRIDDKRKQDAIGKYLTKTILSRDDSVLGVRGEIVTNKLMDSAENEGLIDQVVKNTTEEPIAKES